MFIPDADRLSTGAQLALRRMLETCAAHTRFILCVENLATLIDPLRSRFLAVRVPAPTEREVCLSCYGRLLTSAQISDELEAAVEFNYSGDTHARAVEALPEIVASCRRNLRQAILQVEAAAESASAPHM